MKKLNKWIDGEGSESVEDLERETPTKKVIVFMAMILLWCNAFSQGYIGTSLMNKGIGATAGILAGKADISFNVQFPLTELTVPTILSLSVGRMINLTNNDEGNNYSLTPAFGIATSKVKRIVAAGQMNKEFYDRFSHETLETIRKVSTYYSLEVGKDAYLGRVFLRSVYCGNIYYSVGMRLFLTRNN